jgi:hypothetical protein
VIVKTNGEFRVLGFFESFILFRIQNFRLQDSSANLSKEFVEGNCIGVHFKEARIRSRKSKNNKTSG